MPRAASELGSRAWTVRRRARRGSWASFLVASLAGLLAILAVVVNHSHLWHTQQEQRLSADAASLAAVGNLVDDDFLAGDEARLLEVLDRARAAAHAFAARNPVRGVPLVLREHLTDPQQSDIAFGVLTSPRNGTLSLVDPATLAGSNTLFQINTVRIIAGQTGDRQNSIGMFFGPFVGLSRVDLEVRSIATLDAELRGFRPLPYQNVPLAPLALLSDPTGANAESWQYQVELGNGPDQYRFDRNTRQFVSDPAGDGLHEFRARLATAPGLTNTALLYFGDPAGRDAPSQIERGLNAAELVQFGGALLLDTANEVLVPGSKEGPAENSAELAALVDALMELQASGEARVWPLYEVIDAGNELAHVRGFVAARVVRVTPPAPNQPLEILLQPARLATATAVTARDLELIGSVPFNPYVSKIRLLD